MSMIFKFRMLSDEDENFVRDYELSYDATLKEFHNLICEDLSYDDQEMASFFLTDDRWQKIHEYTLFDMGINDGEIAEEAKPIAMDDVILGQVLHSKHERLLYVFDLFEDRAFFVELIESKKAEPAVVYPRILFKHGDAPDQFDASKSNANKSIFDEAMGGFEDFEGDDSYDDEY